MSTIDLNTPPLNHKFSVSVEREEALGERNVRLFKDVTLFIVAILFRRFDCLALLRHAVVCEGNS